MVKKSIIVAAFFRDLLHDGRHGIQRLWPEPHLDAEQRAEFWILVERFDHLHVFVIVDPALRGQRGVPDAQEVSKAIEAELRYPGQIRIVVIREQRCLEYAR